MRAMSERFDYLISNRHILTSWVSGGLQNSGCRDLLCYLRATSYTLQSSILSIVVAKVSIVYVR